MDHGGQSVLSFCPWLAFLCALALSTICAMDSVVSFQLHHTAGGCSWHPGRKGERFASGQKVQQYLEVVFFEEQSYYWLVSSLFAHVTWTTLQFYRYLIRSLLLLLICKYRMCILTPQTLHFSPSSDLLYCFRKECFKVNCFLWICFGLVLVGWGFWGFFWVLGWVFLPWRTSMWLATSTGYAPFLCNSR